MNILKYEYKAHRLIKIIFYLISFVLGFLIGVGVKELKINSILCTLLGIDDVHATVLAEYNDITFDEKKIYEIFNSIDGYSYSEYPYISCRIDEVEDSDGSLSKDWSILQCNAYSQEYFDVLELNTYYFDKYNKPVGKASYLYCKKPVGEYTYYQFSYHLNGKLDAIQTKTTKSADEYMNIFDFPKGDYKRSYTNFKPSIIKNVPTSVDTFPIYLDFEDLTINLEFNENLFANNDNFYQYCAKSGSSYAITRVDNSENLDKMSDYDYIWFPYGLNGFSVYNYSDFISTPDTEDIENYDFDYDFFTDKETIKKIIANIPKSTNYRYKGYTDLYSYYGWFSKHFYILYDYTNETNFNFFPIITFDRPAKVYVGSSGTLHGGGGLHIDEQGNIDREDLNYCFYIKKDYAVTEVHKDTFGDFYGDVPTPGGNLSFETSSNKDNYDSDSSFGTITSFITNIGDELGFIKDTVLNFFKNMPTLLQLFILAIFNVLLIKIIIGMVTR